MAQTVKNANNLTAGQLFWNVYTNYQNKLTVNPADYDYNREVITYLQADKRYLPLVDEYLENADKPQDEKQRLRAHAVETHQQSVDTLNTTEGYSTDVQAVSDNLYDTVERFDVAQLGDLAAAPEGGVTAEPVTTPSTAESLPVQIREEIQPEPAPEASAPEQQEDDVTELETLHVSSTARDTTDYTVGKGDSLWKIAKEFYGLESPKDIQRAVDHIARTNGMGEGTKANHLSIGQHLDLPDNPVPPQGTQTLDWAALDKETKAGLAGTFANAALGRTESAPTAEAEADITSPQKRVSAALSGPAAQLA